MKLETMNTKDLLFVDYRYEHCDGDCSSCPLYNEDFCCYEIHDEIRAELNKRGE